MQDLKMHCLCYVGKEPKRIQYNQHNIMCGSINYTWDDMVEYYVTEARVDAGKTDKEKREARADRDDTSGLDFFHTISRGKKKVKGRKTNYDSQGNMVRKYKTMQNDKKQAQRERDADEQRSRDRGGMSRGTWDKN